MIEQLQSYLANVDMQKMIHDGSFSWQFILSITIPLLLIWFFLISYQPPKIKFTEPSKLLVNKPTVGHLLVEESAMIQRSVKNNDLIVDSKHYDVIIIGAGVAGGALGCSLAKLNLDDLQSYDLHDKNYQSSNHKNARKLRILILERDLTEPERIVGELLQPAGVERLKELGLEECLSNIDSQEILGYGMTLDKQWINLPYPLRDNNQNQAESLHVRGRSFHNGRLLTNFRNKLRTFDNIELKEATVQKLMYSEKDGRITGVLYKEKVNNSNKKKTDDDVDEYAEHIVRAPLTFVCDGFNSGLRQPLHHGQVEIKSKFLGLILKNADLPYNNHGHVILADPTPVLVYPISSTEARMLIDFPDRLPNVDNGELDKHLFEHVLPQLPEQIHKSFVDAVKERRFKLMPNRSLFARPYLIAGAMLVGDSLNMRHPLTGGGMTVAFSDIVNLIKLLKLNKINDFSKIDKLDSIVLEHYEMRDRPVAVINILADALYDVCCYKYPELREACFHYLKLGGLFADGPIRFLSGMSHSQPFLLMHFFAVAFYGLGRILLPFPTPSKIMKGVNTIRSAVKIIIPLIQQHNSNIIVRAGCSVVRCLFWV